jgi:hypothetical protein
VFQLDGAHFVLLLAPEFSPIADPATPIDRRHMEEVLESVAACGSGGLHP